MTVNLSALAGAGQQFFDNNGVPLTGGKLYSYAAGTTTPAATYTSNTGGTAHTNPIVLDSAGRVPGGEIWLDWNISYKFILKTSADVLIATWDNIGSIASSAAGLVYTPAATSLLGTTPISVKSALDQITNEETGSSVIGFLPDGTDAVPTTVQAKLREWVSVLDFGADPTGVTESTNAFADALAASLLVYVPEGTYLIDQITISRDGTQLFTAGMSVIIQQKNTAGRTDSPIIRVEVSNVTIGDMTFIGNIATDTGEFNHCIQVQDPLSAVSEIRNITLGNYYATNIRGDVLYVGGITATPIYDVNVISLDGDNIYRSICSITGGHGVRIQQILGNRVGYRNIDFESNTGSQTVDDCWVGYVRGGCIQLASDSASVRVGSIQIDQADLATSYMPAPTPYASFTNPAGPDIGVLLNRYNYLKIGSLKIDGFGSVGIINGQVGSEDKSRLVIDYLEATNIAPTGTYQTVIESSGATLVEINSGKVTLEAGTDLLKGLDADYTIRNIEFVGTVNAGLAGFCTDLYCENIAGDFGNGTLFGEVANGQVINSRLVTTGYAMNQCNDMSWYNCTLDCGTFDYSPGAGSNKAAFDRGTLNGTWYDSYNVVFGGVDWSSQIAVATGTGSPEGVLTAAIGALYVNLTGGVSTTLYIKTSGTGNTGWTAK